MRRASGRYFESGNLSKTDCANAAASARLPVRTAFLASSKIILSLILAELFSKTSFKKAVICSTEIDLFDEINSMANLATFSEDVLRKIFLSTAILRAESFVMEAFMRFSSSLSISGASAISSCWFITSNASASRPSLNRTAAYCFANWKPSGVPIKTETRFFKSSAIFSKSDSDAGAASLEIFMPTSASAAASDVLASDLAFRNSTSDAALSPRSKL